MKWLEIVLYINVFLCYLFVGFYNFIFWSASFYGQIIFVSATRTFKFKWTSKHFELETKLNKSDGLNVNVLLKLYGLYLTVLFHKTQPITQEQI